MFTDKCLLLMSETMELLNGADQVRMINTLNTILHQVRKKGINIIVPNTSDNTEDLTIDFQYMNVTILEDQALLNSLGYGVECTYDYPELEAVKNEIREKNPYRQRDSIDDMFTDARKRVKKIVKKILPHFKMIIAFGNPIVVITDKTLKGDYLLIKIDEHAKVTSELSGQKISLSMMGINV